MKEITQKRIKELLHYNPNEGNFIWKNATGCIKKGDIAGSVSDRGYITISINKKCYRSHRLAFLYMNGTLPKNEIDHIDHDRSNNRWINLREVSSFENSKNMKIFSNNTSGSHGVYFDKVGRKWVSQIFVNFKKIYLGRFIEKSDAIKARKHAERIYKFHKNHGQ